MALTHPYSGTEAKAEEPIDEELFDLKVKENLEGLDTRLVAVEGGGGSGGGTTFEDAVGEIVVGGKDNVARLRKRRFSPFINTLKNGANKEGFDLEGKYINDRVINNPNYPTTTTWTRVVDAKAYNGEYLSLSKDGEISFKIKKGENFFALGYRTATLSDNIEILIDGQTPTVLGLNDIDDIAAANSFTTNTAATRYATVNTFFDLDGKEHIITIKNNDSLSRAFHLEFIEFGTRAHKPTITHTVKVGAGRMSARFGEVDFSETDLSFGQAQEGHANGHTAAVVGQVAGLTALDGESPAMTFGMPEVVINFSGTVTSLKVMNNWYFRNNGICLLTLPSGEHSLFSYNGKTDSQPQNHSLDSILWQSQPKKDFTPLAGFGGGANAARGDATINYLGTAPILIDSTNNKLDFKLTVNGVQTTHAATIASGRYAADFVPLGPAIEAALQTAKAIDGEYSVTYSSEKQVWVIRCNDPEVSELQLLFSSGINEANSVHTTLGYPDTDKTGDLSYIATTEVQHLCARVHQADKYLMHANDPRVKYTFTEQDIANTSRDDVQERLDFGYIRFRNHGGTNTYHAVVVFPDEDCTGLSASFVGDNLGGQIVARIDNGDNIYLINTQQQMPTTAVRPEQGKLVNCFISFPRGSHRIEFFIIRDDEFSNPFNNAGYMLFAGARQFFTKPAWEKLTLDQAIVKTYDVAPISLYATEYGNNVGAPYLPYSPSTGDNIDTITETGSWFGVASQTSFNNTLRGTSTLNDYVDIEFTLAKDGGGFFLKLPDFSASAPAKVGFFLNTQLAGITEGTDRIRNYYNNWAASSAYYDFKALDLRGLPAGAYILRIKKESAGTFYYSSIGIVDGVPPNLDVFVVADQPNNLMSTTYPVNVIREASLLHQKDRVPAFLQNTHFNEGRVLNLEDTSNVDMSINNYEDSNLVTTWNNYFSVNRTGTRSISDYIRTGRFFKSIALVTGGNVSVGTIIQPSFNNLDTVNTDDIKKDTKAGSSSQSGTRNSFARRAVFLPERACAFSAGNVFTLPLTIGIKDNMRALLWDGTNLEDVIVASTVTDVSFTVKEARSVVVDANVTHIYFYGFHSFKVRDTTANSTYISHLEIEPLPVSSSKSLNRLQAKTRLDTQAEYFEGVANGDSLYYPVHSDGVAGNWATSKIIPLGSSAGSAYSIPEDLRDIKITSGTMNFKIISTREVPITVDEGSDIL